MYFTKQDYERILGYILDHSKKDTQFENASEIDGKELLSIIQEGVNKNITLRELLSIFDEHGVKLKVLDDIFPEGEWTNSQVIGQKATSEGFQTIINDVIGYDSQLDKTIQQQINELKAGNVNFTLSVSPSIIFNDVENNVTITASVDGATASTIDILKGSTVIKTGTNVSSLAHTDSRVSSTTNYSSNAIIFGNTKTASATVTAVGHIYYGSGSTEEDYWSNKVAKSSPAYNPKGDYNVSVRIQGDYVWFAVPSSMTITGATMGGFDFPIAEYQQSTHQGYKIYKSANTYIGGDTLTITII